MLLFKGVFNYGGGGGEGGRGGGGTVVKTLKLITPYGSNMSHNDPG